MNDYFHCFSIREVKRGETQLLQYLVNRCEQSFHEEMMLNEA